ncbi:MAG: hypothetical protein JNL25_18200 [Rhodospirillaceae bacterium]|nr:hypothetical protein [Rhodospirillaceae bacterium]
MTKKQFFLAAAILAILGAGGGALLRPGLADAQAPFAGSWDVFDVQPAPWLAGDYQPYIHDDIAKGRITFMASSVQAPGLLDCDKAAFEVATVPPEFLFQGGLNDPARQAAALGHNGADIRNLAMTCANGNADISMDFSLIDDDLIVFALDNMIYRMRRVNPEQ